jgi:hypothetical protein
MPPSTESPPLEQTGELHLGTENVAVSASGLQELAITHRLSCLMTKEQEVAWMAFASGESDTFDRAEFSTTRGSGNGTSSGTAAVQAPVEVALCPMADEDAFMPFAADLLEPAAAFMQRAVSTGGRVYVHCTHGVSRSPTAVLWFLMQYRGMTLLEAAELVKARRVKVSPTGGFVTVLMQAEVRFRGSQRSSLEDVLAVFRRKWLKDFQAGRVKLSQSNRIL